MASLPASSTSRTGVYNECRGFVCRCFISTVVALRLVKVVFLHMSVFVIAFEF